MNSELRSSVPMAHKQNKNDIRMKPSRPTDVRSADVANLQSKASPPGNRDLLTAALNKNQVTFSQVAKTAEQLSNGVLKLKTDPTNKKFVFEYMNKKVYIDLNALRIGGLTYIGDKLIEDIVLKNDIAKWTTMVEQISGIAAALKLFRELYNTQSHIENKPQIGEGVAHGVKIINDLVLKCGNGYVNVNGVHYDPTGINENVSLITYQYYLNHKDELRGINGTNGVNGRDGINGINGPKGDKGDKGDRGFSAFEFWQIQDYGDFVDVENEEYSNRLNEYQLSIKGEKGDTGLTGPAGEDANQANMWIWDLINTGLTAGSYLALAEAFLTVQNELGSIMAILKTMGASDVLNQVPPHLEGFDEIIDPIDTTTTWGKVTNWFKDCWNRIRGVEGTYRTMNTAIQQPLVLAEEFVGEFGLMLLGLTRDLPSEEEPADGEEDTDIKSFTQWCALKYPNIKGLVATTNGLMKNDNIDTTKNLFAKLVYLMIGELSDRIDSCNDPHKHSVKDITDLEDEFDALQLNVIFPIRDLVGTKADVQHVHSINDITDYVAYDDSELRTLVDSKADVNHVHTINDITDYVA